MVDMILRLLQCRAFVWAAIVGVSGVALGGAYVAQYVFELQPCALCEWQRIPFWAVLAVAVALSWTKKWGVGVGVCGVLFAANAALAFHHTGVEQHWWTSVLEACIAPAQVSVEAIMSAPAVPCDVIPWADPVLGLSMAVYNFLLCSGMAVFCGLSVWAARWRR